jgi:hypothetical protein
VAGLDPAIHVFALHTARRANHRFGLRTAGPNSDCNAPSEASNTAAPKSRFAKPDQCDREGQARRPKINRFRFFGN